MYHLEINKKCRISSETSNKLSNWEIVEEDITISVPDVTGLLLPVAQANIIGENLTVGNIVPVFDDMSAAG